MQKIFSRRYSSLISYISLKPSKEIFQTVLLETGIRAEETFFIDDSAANCKTAESLGIHTYTPKDQEDWGHIFK